MTRRPQRLINDPEFAEIFKDLSEEQGCIEGLPDTVRQDVATMVSASVAGAVGLVALGGVTSSAVPVGGSAASGGALSTVAAGSTATTAGAVSGTVASGSVAAASSAALGSGVASTGVVASTAAGGLSIAGGFGAASASLAALGVVPKIIATVSLVGAVTAGGVVATRQAPAVPERAVAAPMSNEQATHESVSPPEGSIVRKAVPALDLSTLEDDAERSSRELAQTEAEELTAENRGTSAGAGDRTVHRPDSNASGGGLAGEVNLLRKARLSMNTNPEQAWVFLNAYHRRYPQGALRSEYETLVKRVQSTSLSPPANATGD